MSETWDSGLNLLKNNAALAPAASVTTLKNRGADSMLTKQIRGAHSHERRENF